MKSESVLANGPVRGSRSGRPIMALLDLLGRRWIMRIVWELRSGESMGFRELQSVCDGMSPSVMNQRLKELVEALIIESASDGRYRLSARGRQLLELFAPLNQWAETWSRALRNSPQEK